MIKSNNVFNINKLVNTFIENKIGNHKLENNNLKKFRYEYLYNSNDKNIKNVFIYLKDWNQFINLYKVIPETNRHLYEIIDEKCKFFLDLDAKCSDIEHEEWNNNIKFIKQELIIFFQRIFNKSIQILEYQSFPTNKESKYSCHLIVPYYCFYAEDCKNIIKLFINKINIKYKKIIDDKVYGKRRMLRIEGSSKINSDRKKVYINDYKNNYQLINLDGLITNLENTELLYTELHTPTINKKVEYICEQKHIVLDQISKNIVIQETILYL